MPSACTTRALDKNRVPDSGQNPAENEPLSRIRSWSRASIDSGTDFKIILIVGLINSYVNL